VHELDSDDEVKEEERRSQLPEDLNLNYNNWTTSQLVVFKEHPERIKKDALYKPLLRKMRQYFRTLMDRYNLTSGY